MHTSCTATAAAVLLAGSLAAQQYEFDDLTWGLQAPPGFSGSLTSELMQVTGPSFGLCSNAVGVY